MEIEKIVDLTKVHPIALKYADAILAGMPPKQADIQRMAITKMCELLFVEAEIQGRLLQIDALNGFLKQPLTEANLIFAVVQNRFCANHCSFNPLGLLDVRYEIQNLPISVEGKFICEAVFQHFERYEPAKNDSPEKGSADQV